MQANLDVTDFVKNPDLLKEDYRIVQGFAKFTHIDLEKRLYSLERSCVVAVVGPYGSGKSTALHRIKEHDKKAKWLQFDAWRYPERKVLWDGLIIEVAKQLGVRKQAVRKVEGHASAIGKWGGIIPEIFTAAGNLMPKGTLEWVGDRFSFSRDNDKPKEITDATKVGGKVAEVLFSRSPAKRVYEFEQILTDMLLSVEETTIFIVVEDVDRSGAEGINFLETLSFFLNNNDRLAEKTIVAIAPISDISYKENVESYLKCVDYIEQFVPRMVHMDDFIQSVFGFNMRPEQLSGSRSSLPLEVQQIKGFLEKLFKAFPSQMNMRKLKIIIREASLNYKLQQLDGFLPDWRVVVAIQSTKYLFNFRAHDSNTAKTYYEELLADKSDGNSYFSRFIAAIIDNKPEIERADRPHIIALNMSAAGLDTVIEYDFDTGGMPRISHFKDVNGDHDAHIALQGFYFRY